MANLTINIASKIRFALKNNAIPPCWVINVNSKFRDIPSIQIKCTAMTLLGITWESILHER